MTIARHDRFDLRTRGRRTPAVDLGIAPRSGSVAPSNHPNIRVHPRAGGR
jgi:hypothetical protein